MEFDSETKKMNAFIEMMTSSIRSLERRILKIEDILKIRSKQMNKDKHSVGSITEMPEWCKTELSKMETRRIKEKKRKQLLESVDQEIDNKLNEK